MADTQEPYKYYIQNCSQYVGNCVLWWRVDGHGYTCNLDEAWRVTKEQADNICHDRPKQDIAWPAVLIDALVKRHMDMQLLPKRAALTDRTKRSTPARSKRRRNETD